MQNSKAHWIGVGAIACAAGYSLGTYGRQRQRPLQSFSGRTVVITGGSRGLGLEMARLFGKEGAQLAICARSDHDLERAYAELRKHTEHVLTSVCDVRDRTQVEMFIDRVASTFGGIDVLVNNAGVIQAGPIECMTLEDFDNAMATHFWGPLYMMRAGLPHLCVRKGRIVNIASIGGEIAVPHLVPYSASKFALVGLSDGLSRELRQFGIRVTTVCPGLMRTGSARNAEFKGRHRDEYAWFSIGDSLPVVSMDSQRAARQIVEACRRGRSYLRLTLPAKIAVPLRAVAPNLVGKVLGWVAGLLPGSGGAGPAAHKGAESFSRWSPSMLTRLSDSAAAANNELR